MHPLRVSNRSILISAILLVSLAGGCRDQSGDDKSAPATADSPPPAIVETTPDSPTPVAPLLDGQPPRPVFRIQGRFGSITAKAADAILVYTYVDKDGLTIFTDWPEGRIRAEKPDIWLHISEGYDANTFAGTGRRRGEPEILGDIERRTVPTEQIIPNDDPRFRGMFPPGP